MLPLSPLHKNPVQLVSDLLKREIAQLIESEPNTIDTGLTLDDYGMDSIKLVKLASIIDLKLSLDIDPSDLYSLGTIDAIADKLAKEAFATLSQSTAMPSSESSFELSLDAQCHLPDDIKIQNYNIRSYNTPMDAVFFTGGTGFVGAFILKELLQQTTANIYCLIRAKDSAEGFMRLQHNLKKYHLWSDSFISRLHIVIGDLAQASFGMTEDQFNALAEKVDTIFHCGAWVNFVYSYQHLKKANVDSIETILRMSLHDKSKPKQVHFISTIGIAMSAQTGLDNTVYEDEELINVHDLPNGYEQTKYVADKLLFKAIHERNIPASIYRLGFVSGDSKTGYYPKMDEFLTCLIKGCLELGIWPQANAKIEMVPVDFIAKSVVHIMTKPKNLGKVYFALHPNPKPVADFVYEFQNQGYQCEVLSWEEWKNVLFNLPMHELHQSALFPFSGFIKALANAETLFPQADKTNFLNAIADLNFEGLDQIELLQKYHQYFLDVGYYEPAESNAVSA